MTPFSFGAGNARKLAGIPGYVLGRIATTLIPRARGRWVFGSGAGIADGALALWQVAAADGVQALWLVTNDRDAQDAAARGIPTRRASSIRGFWQTARAQVVVVTHGFGDVNRYAVDGAHLVQLWHGIPLKRIGLDSPETLRVPRRWRQTPLARPLRALLRVMYRRATRRIDLIPAASHLVRARLESAFGLPDECVPVTGEPRVDVLSAGTARERRARAREAITAAVGTVGDARLVLYAPTWRDGDEDAGVPGPAEWARITALLREQEAVLLVRPHPLGAGAYDVRGRRDVVRMLGSDLVRDVTPLLPGMDMLITDYSSLAFDASLVPLPTVFFAPDVEAYRARRGMYGSYDDVATAGWETDWDAAMTRVQALLTDATAARAARNRARALSADVHAFADGGNTRRVYRRILAETSARRVLRAGGGRRAR